jgi:hypothetical protein
MKLLIACLVVLSLLVCLPAAASANGYGMPVSALGGAGYGAPVAVVNQAVIHHRPGLLGRIHAARQAFHRGF